MEPIDLTQSNLTQVPEPWNALDLKGVMIDPSLIQKRVCELAIEIRQKFPLEEPNAIVSLLSGAFLFTADLVRHWDFSMEIDFMGVSSYGNNTESGDLTWTHPLKIDLKNKHVLIVDDILDTGQTLRAVRSKLEASQPASVRSCVLLQKIREQASDDNFEADFVGFRIPDEFVVGYGLDFAMKFRQLPFIGVLNAPGN